MGALKNPLHEARRVQAVIAALKRDKRWLRAIEPQNFTAAGMRARGQNRLKSGVDSLALNLARRYADAVFKALSKR